MSRLESEGVMTGLPRYLREIQDEITGYAKAFGLDFFTVIFEVLTYEQMNEIASYGGFPNRYPHWRFGMEYEHLSKSYSYGLSKIYEMVINNDPTYAYLLEGNSTVEQKLVMAHVHGHVDFFKNNFYFSKTNRRMIDEMANHGSRVRRYMERYGVDKVEQFIDVCLSLDNLIDPYSPYIERRAKPRVVSDEPETVEIPKLKSKDYMDSFINPKEFVDRQRQRLEREAQSKKHFPERPERDVLKFLLEHAPLETWERDVLDVVRDEAYYFAPQAMTKIMNEGWACLSMNSRVYTNRGLVTIRHLVEGGGHLVSDGERPRLVTDRTIFRDRATITMRTRRGLQVTGSENHRVLLADGATWKRLDELAIGERVRVSGGQGLWPTGEVELDWKPGRRVGLADVAEAADVSVWTVLRHRAGRTVRRAAAVEQALQAYEAPENLALPQSMAKRSSVTIPSRVDEGLGALLGYLVGDGHISRVKRNFGLTTGDRAQAVAFRALVRELFGLEARLKLDGSRYRVLASSETVADFLEQALGLTSGPSARDKSIPEAVLRSPEPVVRAFLRAYFDCDGHAGRQGVILSTTSDELAEKVQLLLLNYGILTRRRRQRDGTWHVHAAGASAARFAERIGFGLVRKQKALRAYVRAHAWFKEETWDDEVVSLEPGRADVYDITVEETHRYAAQGFVNHNSFWHSRIMTEKALRADEVIDYADRCAGVLASAPGRINPYKIGIELFRNIEERWDRGQFGKEWEECDDLAAKRSWDQRLMQGRQKIFQVRALYNDITFIDEFLTYEFCAEHKLFTFGYNARNDRYEIETREFKAVKDKLLSQLTNLGNPFIFVKDGNYENRGELLLWHEHQGADLKIDWARDTLTNLHRIWHRPCCIETIVEGKPTLLRYDGTDHSAKTIR